MSGRELGLKGEDEAVKYLQANGYRILERNYRCRIGEVDIIAMDRETLVFIEVKARTGTLFGYPQEAVSVKKQKKIRTVSRQFLYLKKIQDVNCRFDVLAIKMDNNWQPVSIDHIKNAF